MRKYKVEKHATFGNTASTPRPSNKHAIQTALHTKKLKKQKCRKENKQWDELTGSYGLLDTKKV
jgi:hypothetical protein